MRIDSASIGMDSARLYRSSVTYIQTSEYRSNSIVTSGSQLGQSFDGFLTGNRFGTAKNTKEDEEEKESLPGAKNTDSKQESGNASTLSNELLIDPEETSDTSLVNAMAKMKSPTNIKVMNYNTRNDAKETFQKLRQKILQNILEMIYGKKKKCKEDEEITQDTIDLREDSTFELVTITNTTTMLTTESEFTEFNAKGMVKTDDGREIDINLSLNMSRRFTEYYSESISTLSYQLTDPLVINLENAPASLSDMKFYFDLDADGVLEEISGLKSGSGYLALDKNEDGTINDGSELFGTKSGDGFKDLSKYDEDGNGWIDENDSIFTKLKIWTKDEDGNDLLYTLKEKDVGAIYLGNLNTEFGLCSKVTNEANGFIRKTGIFLYENGNTGTMQHIDLVS